jgi:hypothetical protein
VSYITSSPENASALAGVDRLQGAGDDEASGWLFFAASVLGIAGVMRIIDAIWAFSYNGALPDRLQDGVLGDDLTNYAWLWLGVGAILILASVLLMVRSQFARWVGMFAAGIAMISAVVWLPYFPVWALVYIGLAMSVFYALAVHGGRVDTT